ncbi:MAG TPA: hypothetical protein VKS25_11405 [Solirubrobacteraceae bacterium]|nr:hypothetical protein [Solirubrobacteraceae bacterium]
MIYTVTVAPALSDTELPQVRGTFDALGKDDALAQAESAYRRRHPRAGHLKLHVLRIRVVKTDAGARI